MNKTVQKYLTFTGLLFSFCLINLLFLERAQALTWDFNGGTNQGWTVEFNTDPGADPAFWYDGVNYSGNPAIGRPPAYGPQDDFDGSKGAIGRTGDDDSISVFYSTSFWVPLAMDNISARFIISGMEYGIPASLNVYGQVGYKKLGSESYFFGANFPLDRVIHSGGLYAYPLWTRASVSVGEGDMVTQVIVRVHVEKTPWGWTQNWIDYVTDTDLGQFADVPPGFWAEEHIYAIYEAGITQGCSKNPPKYCPKTDVTREQMAAFIVRADDGEPPADYCDTGSPFLDVPSSSIFCKYIKRLSELGITQGCGGGNYCPKTTVNREQMAAFLVRAVDGEPPADYCAAGSPFSDVPQTSVFCKYIKKLSELGITKGCGGGKYCPKTTVKRDQMAVFLARAFLDMD